MLSLADLALGLAPGLFWLWFLRRKDDWEPEPKVLLLRVFLLGACAAFVIIRLRPRAELFLPVEMGWRQDLGDAFLVTALFEELVKLAAFWLGAFRHRELDEPMDGILYGAAAALGFASIENAVFVATSADPSIVVARAFTATLAHVAFTGCAAFLLGLSRLRPGRWAGALALGGFVLAVGLHGAYDLFLHSWPQWSVISLLVVLPLGLALLAWKIHWSRSQSPLFHPRGEGAGGAHAPSRMCASVSAAGRGSRSPAPR